MNMTKFQYFLLSIFLGVTSLGQAETPDSFSHANERTPEVTVRAVSEIVNAGDLKRDGLEATFEFWIEAETDQVNLSCLVSDLNLRNDVNDSSGVQLDSSKGCRIEVIDGYSVAGKNWELVDFKNERHTIDGSLNARKSDYVTFRTIDATNFRRNVYVTVSWLRSGESKPVGNYEGSVKLLAAAPDKIYPAK